jgi:hypothetical protein
MELHLYQKGPTIVLLFCFCDRSTKRSNQHRYVEKYFLMRKNSSVNPFDPEYYQNQTCAWLDLTQAFTPVKLKVTYQ